MKIFVVLDETEFPCHAATYAHACQEHINDAIEGGIEEAAKWVVREFIAAPPAQTALTDDARYAARYRDALELALAFVDNAHIIDGQWHWVSEARAALTAAQSASGDKSE